MKLPICSYCPYYCCMRLTNLFAQMASADSAGSSFAGTSHPSSTTATIRLTSEELMAYHSWTKLVHFWGWQLSEKPSLSGGYLLGLPHFQGRVLDPHDFRAYLRQLLDTNGKSQVPNGVQKILASAACRSAVMFGDKLDRQQGQELLDKLKVTQLCFQCAHGRPTMAPLFDFAALEEFNPSKQRVSGGRKAALGMQALKTKLERDIQS